MRVSTAERAALGLTAGALLLLVGWTLHGAVGGESYTLSGAHPRQPVPTPAVQAVVSDARVDINTANLSELIDLPGVGLVRARAILDYRNAHGPFDYPEDLMDVPGVGRTTYERVVDRVTTSNP